MNDTKKDQVDIRSFQETYFNYDKYQEMQKEHVEKVKRGEISGEKYVGKKDQ